MEKLEETEAKRRISIKMAVALTSLMVFFMIKQNSVFLMSISHANSSGGFLGGIHVVRVYIQARQDHLQQIPSIHFVDSNNVCIS